MFAKRSLDCQGDCSRCYSISKLSQMLYAFIADAIPILLPVPSPALLRYPLPYWMVFALCFFFLRHMPYNLRGGNPAFYLLQGHSQIQLVSCCEGFPSRLKERFLHFNNRIISLFGTDCMNQFVYFSYIILLVYQIVFYTASHLSFLSTLCKYIKSAIPVDYCQKSG